MTPTTPPVRHALIGTGSRSQMYLQGIAGVTGRAVAVSDLGTGSALTRREGVGR